ncbi:hypothetical protein I7I51_06909 [Histoplasma capsulatum]|uniref:Uncharacterized protein n=1 Tax=Ajellomyces capsulatus TaxID=5037 RepID=A0A8A1MHG2_AJECA|nr:hypothetical protein I7I51_06909 [Histoplasma capsulatum]
MYILWRSYWLSFDTNARQVKWFWMSHRSATTEMCSKCPRRIPLECVQLRSRLSRSYSSHPPPQLGRNTTNQAYSYLDIRGLQIWQGFNLKTILQQYHNVLNGVMIAADPMPVSPPRPITAENVLQAQICEILRPHIRRSL